MTWTKLYPVVIRILFFFFSCVIWQGVAHFLRVIPGPIEVLCDAILLLQSNIAFDILISVWRVVVAMGISLIVGVSLGLLSVRLPLFNMLISTTLVPVIEALPPLTWIIICVLIIGIGENTVIFAVCIILIQFFIVSTIEGFKNIDRDLVEMAKSFPLGQAFTSDNINFSNRMNILKYVESGMIIPYLITATRLAYGVAWKVIVIAEMFGASEGVGYLINQAYSTLSITRLISLSALVVLLFSLGDHLILQNLERRFRKWQALS